MSESVQVRLSVERAIVSRCVADLLALGYSITVEYVGDEDALTESRDQAAISASLHACDEERLHVHRPGEDKPFGWVYLVYGNSGWDVISDYTVNLEEALSGARGLSDDIEAGNFSIVQGKAVRP